MLETDLTRIEKKIMKIIWENDERLHLRNITDQVNEYFQKGWRPQTISTYLAKLIKKGYLSMERSGKVFLYTAEITEKEFFDHEIRNVLEYFSEFGLVDFLETYSKETYSQECIEQIKEMLNEQ